ncbi:hypothetical protein H0W91_02045 [Patescibacteria group bacterium]|nr:hypothetical protein [Patescibacteria group bacterium]
MSFKKILKSVLLVVVVLYVGVVIYRMFYFHNLKSTQAVVENIHSTHITLDDVMGKNLPPEPGIEADKTIVGIDANHNGIRDDVELAIFKEYPTSAKKRAVSLQYAQALQMEFTQSYTNTDIVIAVAQEGDRASLCTTEVFSRSDQEKFFKENDELVAFVEKQHINTTNRKSSQQEFYKKIGSYNSLERHCDIDYSKLPN